MANIEAIYDYLSNGNRIGVADRPQFGITSISDMIRELATSKEALMHASRADIQPGALLNKRRYNDDHLVYSMISKGTPVAFATNYPNALFISALFDNKHNLDYKYGNIAYVELSYLEKEIVSQKGYIYLLNNTTSFQKTSYSTWEYFTAGNDTTFGGSVEVTFDDWPSGVTIKSPNIDPHFFKR